jgi:hypothetical protein
MSDPTSLQPMAAAVASATATIAMAVTVATMKTASVMSPCGAARRGARCAPRCRLGAGGRSAGAACWAGGGGGGAC